MQCAVVQVKGEKQPVKVSPMGRNKLCKHETVTLRGLFLKDSTVLSHPCGHTVHLLPSPVLHTPRKKDKIYYQLCTLSILGKVRSNLEYLMVTDTLQKRMRSTLKVNNTRKQ